jgi:hypothetical protein
MNDALRGGEARARPRRKIFAFPSSSRAGSVAEFSAVGRMPNRPIK